MPIVGSSAAMAAEETPHSMAAAIMVLLVFDRPDMFRSLYVSWLMPLDFADGNVFRSSIYSDIRRRRRIYRFSCDARRLGSLVFCADIADPADDRRQPILYRDRWRARIDRKA
ncbi:hypothetical protein [Lichenicola sp.]|uniref:hypothetical protein n=1 Tax=Lichenicola sp. TaxID=2804529 RepID=UPI003AFFCC36